MLRSGGIGLVTGLLFGFFAGIADGNDDTGFFRYSAVEKGMVLGVFGGGIVGFGALVGAGISNLAQAPHHTFEFPHQHHEPSPIDTIRTSTSQ